MAQVIQQLGFLSEGLKGVRGLYGEFAVAGIERAIVSVAGLAANLDGVEIKPGEEAPVVVPLPELPRNADIKSLKAFIEIRKGTSAQTSSIKQKSVVKEGDQEKTYDVDISLPELPMNVSVKLDGGEVFWSFAGREVEGERELADFTEQANDYLDRLSPNGGEVALKFLVKSDGPGNVKITVKDVEYSVIQTQSWPNPLDNTVRLDRNFQLDFGSIEKVTVDAFAGETKQPLSLSVVRADVGGEFGPERLLGGFEAHRGDEFATISSDYSLAQGFSVGKEMMAKPIRCAGVTGAFQAEAEAEFYVEIQNDAGDFPASGAPLAKSNLTLSPGQGQESKQWAFARFEAPVDLNPETTYWVVVKGIRGKARLGLQVQPRSYLQRASVNRGGQLWKDLGRPPAPVAAAMLRLVYLPELDNQSAAVEISVEGASQRLDPKPEAQTLSLDLPEGRGAGEAVITIKSHARGTLSIANLIQEYAPGEARGSKPGRKKILFRIQDAKSSQKLKK